MYNEMLKAVVSFVLISCAFIQCSCSPTERTKCGSSSQCSGDKIIFETESDVFNCNCDNACYETFQDCCPDLVETCGEQRKTENKTTKHIWKCVHLPLQEFFTIGGCVMMTGPEGIWMIQNCPEGWSLNEIKTKCLHPSQDFSYPLEDFLPVVGKNNLTYRNKHCAICNGEENYMTWDVWVDASFAPPREYIAPGRELPRRYCAGSKYKDSCSNVSHPDYNECVSGAVETIPGYFRDLYYKNKYCAFCNGDNILTTFIARDLQFFELSRSGHHCFRMPLSIAVFKSHASSHALRILTLSCLSISVFFLTLLLVTYGIFKELRTLPGLNLMSLCISMVLSHLILLIGTAYFHGTKVCKILGILEHYLFLVSFMAMCVISYHSCVVFSQSFRTTRYSWRRFAKYSAIVWITPAIFVAVCFTLDETETTFKIYSTTCWLATKAVLYLFILPAAVLLVYDVYTFVQTGLTLSRLGKETRILQNDRRRNILICAKLATLVGFPWIFAFFGVIFPNVEALEYLFVIFGGLQGFYIGLAFVCNKKTLQLYCKWRSK